jgi:hypothetical protein
MENKKEELKPAETKKTEKIEVSKEILEKIISQNEELKKRVDDLTEGLDKPRVVKKVKDHIVRLSRWKGKIVISFDGDLYTKWDERKRQDILYVDVILEDGKKVEEVPFLDFLNTRDVVEAKIISRNVEEKEIIDGYVNKAEFDGNYNMVIKDAVVPLESIVKLTKFEVQLPNNEQYKAKKLIIDEKYVNIQ